jgi:Peptidase A4 family
LTGTPTYTESQATFVVPTAIPGGDGTSNTLTAIWTGLGGYGTQGGLIQGGIEMNTSSSAANYWSFVEYCCGDPGLTSSFIPNPGDTIFVQEWYCDANGLLNADANANGGYGCSFIHDVTTGALMSCTSATDPTCTSVPPLKQPNWIIGNSADFVMELQDYPTFTDFGTVSMSGEAASSSGWKTISTDSSVIMLTDFTPITNPVHVVVTLDSPDIVNFTALQGCFPTTCEALGAICGTVNNCGTPLDCGTCAGGDTCFISICCPKGEQDSLGHCCPPGRSWSSDEEQCIIKQPPPKCGGKLPACQ